MKLRNTVILITASCLWSACGHAQARVDSEAVGVAVVLDSCPLTPQADFDLDKQSVESLGGVFLAGVTGDVVEAGMNALGAALEEASREKGFSAVATTSFSFYQVGVEPDGNAIRFAPRLKSESLCLVIALSSTDDRTDATPVPTEYLTGLNADGLTTWGSKGLPRDPDLYVEAALQLRADGFVVRPGLIWYRRPFANAPKRALPAELHIAFSTPAAPTAENGAAFGLARIRLPPMAPGAPWKYAQLRPYVSPVVPLRPTTGSPDKFKTDFVDAITAVKANRDEITGLERALARERKAPKPEQAKVDELEDKLRDVKAKTAALEEKRAAVMGAPVYAGSTNVQARFTVVRNANQFGLAVAKSLQTRSKALGEAVTQRLTPETHADAWNASDTNYVTTMSTVETAQRALDTANAKGDPDEIFAAQLTLRNAKASANAAAAASDRPLPYPNLL